MESSADLDVVEADDINAALAAAGPPPPGVDYFILRSTPRRALGGRIPSPSWVARRLPLFAPLSSLSSSWLRVAALSLDQLAAEAGAGPSVVDCLKARSLYHIPTLALVAASDVEFERNVFGPYKKGFVKDGFTHKPDDEDEANVAKAVLCHLWFGPLGVADGDAAASAGVSPGAAGWLRCGLGGSAWGAQDEKPPKTFAQWAAQVQAYNGRLLDGQPRKFPEPARRRRGGPRSPLVGARASSGPSVSAKSWPSAPGPPVPGAWPPVASLDGATSVGWALTS